MGPAAVAAAAAAVMAEPPAADPPPGPGVSAVVSATSWSATDDTSTPRKPNSSMNLGSPLIIAAPEQSGHFSRPMRPTSSAPNSDVVCAFPHEHPAAAAVRAVRRSVVVAAVRGHAAQHARQRDEELLHRRPHVAEVPLGAQAAQLVRDDLARGAQRVLAQQADDGALRRGVEALGAHAARLGQQRAHELAQVAAVAACRGDSGHHPWRRQRCAAVRASATSAACGRGKQLLRGGDDVAADATGVVVDRHARWRA